MAPSTITEDYYMILGVDQTAGLELISKSYKRLALKLHPDRNAERDATEKFQKVCQIGFEPPRASVDSRKLQRAYETLKDANERFQYDLIYPTIRDKIGSSQYTQKAYTTPAPQSQSGSSSETAQIAALRKSKQDRAARWWISNSASESLVFEAKRVIRRLEQEIKGIDSIFAAEAAVEARKNSWGAWLLSPILKTAEDSDKEKALKEIARQERRMEKDMKERRLHVQREKVKAAELSMREANTEKDAADARDDTSIRNLEHKIWMREDQQRRERERVERDRMAHQQRERERVAREKIAQQMKENEQRRERDRVERERVAQQMKEQREQWERTAREAAETLRQQEAARRKAEQDEYEEQIKRWQKIAEEEESERQRRRYTYFDYDEASASHARTASCRHDGWWPKVQGRAACPECSESWTYLLQCPSCDMKACPRCQAAVRPRHRRVPLRVRTPSPDYTYDYD